MFAALEHNYSADVHSDYLHGHGDRYRRNYNTLCRTEPYYSDMLKERSHNNLENTLKHPWSAWQATVVRIPEREDRCKLEEPRENAMNNEYFRQTFSPLKRRWEPKKDLEFRTSRWDELKEKNVHENKSYFESSPNIIEDYTVKHRKNKILRPPTPDLELTQSKTDLSNIELLQFRNKELFPPENSRSEEKEEHEQLSEMSGEEKNKRRKMFKKFNESEAHNTKFLHGNTIKSDNNMTNHSGYEPYSLTSTSQSILTNTSEMSEFDTISKNDKSELETTSSASTSTTTTSTSTSTETETETSSSSSSLSSPTSTTSSSSSCTSSNERHEEGRKQKAYKSIKRVHEEDHDTVMQYNKENTFSRDEKQLQLAFIAESLFHKETQLKKLELMLSSEKELFAHQLRQYTPSIESILATRSNFINNVCEGNLLPKERYLTEFFKNMMIESDKKEVNHSEINSKGDCNFTEDTKISTPELVQNNFTSDTVVCESTTSFSREKNISSTPPSYEYAVNLNKFNSSPQGKSNLIQATVTVPLSQKEIIEKEESFPAQSHVAKESFSEEFESDLMHNSDISYNNDALKLSNENEWQGDKENYKIEQVNSESNLYHGNKFKKMAANGTKRVIQIHPERNNEENQERRLNNLKTKKEKVKVKVKVRKPHHSITNTRNVNVNVNNNNNNNSNSITNIAQHHMENELVKSKERVRNSGNNIITEKYNHKNYHARDQAQVEEELNGSGSIIKQHRRSTANSITATTLTPTTSSLAVSNSETELDTHASQQIILLAPLSHYQLSSHVVNNNNNNNNSNNNNKNSKSNVEYLPSSLSKSNGNDAINRVSTATDGNIVAVLEESKNHLSMEKTKEDDVIELREADPYNNNKKEPVQSNDKICEKTFKNGTLHSIDSSIYNDSVSHIHIQYKDYKEAKPNLSNTELKAVSEKGYTHTTANNDKMPSKFRSEAGSLISMQSSSLPEQSLLSSAASAAAAFITQTDQNSAFKSLPSKMLIPKFLLADKEMLKRTHNEPIINNSGLFTHSYHDELTATINKEPLMEINNKISKSSEKFRGESLELRPKQRQESIVEEIPRNETSNVLYKGNSEAAERSYVSCAQSEEPLVISFPSPPLQFIDKEKQIAHANIKHKNGKNTKTLCSSCCGK